MKTILTILALSTTLPTQAKNMHEHLNETRNLVNKGEFEEALKRHIWFHENALTHEPGMYGVRLSFALSHWKELAAKHPPALKAIIKIRDDKTKTILDGKQNHHLFHDILAINRTLNKPEKTVSLFETLDKNHPQVTVKYWDLAKDPIIEAKRYDLAAKYIKEPLTSYKKAKLMYDQNTSLYDNPQIGGERFETFNKNNFVEECLKLIEVCQAIDKLHAAKEIQQKSLEIINDPRLKNSIIKKK